MTKNLYYRSVLKRTNTFAEGILNLFFAFSSWPRLLLEVFLRRNMGERYFNFSLAMFLLALMAILPIVMWHLIFHVLGIGTFIAGYATWYLFLAAFLKFALDRRDEVRRQPSVFDFARYSLSTGHSLPFLRDLQIGGKRVDTRTLETLIEPGACFVLGTVGLCFGQAIATVLIVCSLFYSLSYLAAYRQGDHLIMDRIDEMICNEEMVRLFIEGRPPFETRGVPLYGRLPADPDLRQRVADSLLEDEDVAEVL
jgi:hypothetical protein